MKILNGRSKAHPVVAIASLSFVAVCCHGGEPPRVAAGATTTVADGTGVDPASAALVADLEKTPSRVVRVIAMLRPGEKARAQAIDALRASGVSTIEEIGARPMLVIEVDATQLRALLASGQVLSVQPDTPAPTN